MQNKTQTAKKQHNADLAQLVEHPIRNGQVVCSNHIIGTSIFKGLEKFDRLGIKSYPRFVPFFLKLLSFFTTTRATFLYVILSNYVHYRKTFYRF